MIDTELREKIYSYADQAPSSVGLLDAVRARSRHRRGRHRAALAAVAVIVTAASIVAVPALWRAVDGNGSTMPASQPRLNLIPPSYELPSFPFTPGWAPPGSGSPFVGLSRDGMWLQYPRATANGPEIWVDIAPDAPALQKAQITSTEPATVRGRSATMRLGVIGTVPFAGLTWQHTDGRWVTVAGTSGTATAPADDVVHFAESLTAAPMPVLPPFTFDLVPVGTEPAVVQGSMVGTSPPIMQFLSTDGHTTMVVDLKRPEHTPGARTTTVGALPAEVVVDQESGYIGVFVYLDGNRMLQVGGGVDGVSFSPDDLVLFAQGIHLTDQAVIHD